jgi:ribose transport system substrate-binding protein
MDAGVNPFKPTNLEALAEALKNATAGKGDPGNTPLALLTLSNSTFYTPAQIGANRAASELTTPFSFQIPVPPPTDAGTPTDGGVADTLTTRESGLLRSLTATPYAGIGMAVGDPTSQDDLINSAIAQNIQFITFDSDAPATNRFLYLGTDNCEAGKALANGLREVLNDTGKYIVVCSSFLPQNIQDRKKCFDDALKAAPGLVEAQFVNSAGNDRAGIAAAAHAAWVANPDAVAYVTLNTRTGVAVGDSVVADQLTGKVHVIAMDAVPDIQKYLVMGVIDRMVAQRPYWEGYLGVRILFAMKALGQPATKTLLMPNLTGANSDMIDTGIDLISIANLPQFDAYLQTLGISGG